MPAQPSAVRTGSTIIWWWRAPEPVAYGVAPTAEFVDPAGLVLEAVGLTGAFPSLPIAAVSADRQTLTTTGAGVGTSPARGDAWILSSADGFIPVRVVTVATTTVRLAEPLPRDVQAGGYLVPQWYYSAIGGGAVTTAEQRGVTWRTTYQQATALGLAVPTSMAYDDGIIDVVRAPFTTGLSTEDLVSIFDPGGSRVPSRALGYEAAISAGLDDLVALLRSDSPEGLDQHDLNGPELRPVHRWMAAVYLARTQEERAEYTQRGLDLYHRVRDTMWRNAARNGLAPESERFRPQVLVGGTFNTATAARRTWTDVQ